MRVKQVMTRAVVFVEAPGNRKDAIQKMLEHNISGLPVVKKGTKELVGVVTRKDIFDDPAEEQLAMLMTADPFTITPYTSIRTAATLFFKHRMNQLPVVDHDNLVGILTPTDTLRLLEESDDARGVEKFIIKPCTPIYARTPLAAVMRIMRLSGARAMPVLNDEGRLVGILTDRDIFGTARIKEKTVINEYGMGSDEDDWTWEGLRNVMRVFHAEAAIKMPRLPAEKIMNPKVVKVFRKTPVGKAAEIMRRNDFGQLPLVDSRDSLMGMVYNLDLIQALLEPPDKD